MSIYIDLDELEGKLRANLEPLIHELFKGKKIIKRSHEYRIGSQQSQTIKVDGRWYSFEHEQGSKSLVSLICFIKGTAFPEAFQWATAFVQGKSVASKPIPNMDARTSDEKAAYALRLYNQACDIRGTIGEKYLRDIRKIPRISSRTRKTIKFHNRLKHPNGKQYPALLFPLYTPSNSWAGVLRIYLDPATGGKVKDRAKLLLGKTKGAAVRLTDASSTLVVCEGVEDALSILYACPELSVWCGIGANLRSILIPQKVRRIIIATDNDDAGYRIAFDLALRLIAEGRSRVSLMKPDQAKDFNDLLRG